MISFITDNKVGVFYYDDNRGCKAAIVEVRSVSPKGYITLINDVRYSPLGKEIGGNSTLCSVEEAQKLIKKGERINKERAEEFQRYLNSPTGKRDSAVNFAVTAAMVALKSQGWQSDEYGILNSLEKKLTKAIEQALITLDSVNSKFKKEGE